MRRLTAPEVHATHVAQLGLDEAIVDLTSIEALAAALRRMANLQCPCSRVSLVSGVMKPLQHLVDEFEAVTEAVGDTLDAMISYGDLVECIEFEGDMGRGAPMLLYPAPPAFVARESGAVILVGSSADELSLLPDDLSARVEYDKHVRRLSPRVGEVLRDRLEEVGLTRIRRDRWLQTPPPTNAEEHLSKVNRHLEGAVPSRNVPGLSVLNPERPVRYYRGRWQDVKGHSGCFVARRSQAYGNDLWCYVQLKDGNPERLIDFPLPGSAWPGCDEAWRLQLAIDARRGAAQRYRVIPVSGHARVIQLFSPVPRWAQRRWDVVGQPVVSSGCLFAYRFPKREVAEELRFMREELWLDPANESAT